MVCPGFCYTGLFRHVKRSWFHYIFFAPVALLFLRTSKQVSSFEKYFLSDDYLVMIFTTYFQGAQTILHCATDPALSNESGNMYRDCKVYVSKKKLEPEISHKLWEASAKFTGLEEIST